MNFTDRTPFLTVEPIFDNTGIEPWPTCGKSATKSEMTFGRSGLGSVKPSKKIAIPPVGPPAADALKELQSFIQKNASNPAAQVGWPFDLTPRVVKGDSITDYDTGVNVTNAVVWGEGCDD